jgi:FlaA1/EpsC-like NDP-sugar epimerase
VYRLGLMAVSLPRLSKRGIAVLVDVALCAISVWLSVFLRIGALPPVNATSSALTLIAVALAIPVLFSFGTYRQIFSQSGFRSVGEISRAVAVYGLLFSAIFTFVGFRGIPRTVGIIQPILFFLLVTASRIYVSRWLRGVVPVRNQPERIHTLIYGAGSAGRQIAAAIAHSREMKLVGFLDDNPALQGKVMNGVKIHPVSSLPTLCLRLSVTDVLLAMPSASQRRRLEAIDHVRQSGLHVRSLPGLMDLMHGRVRINDIRELDINDLLGRTSVIADTDLLGRKVTGQTVLVTGAGGSIGSELCRQILACNPARLLLVEISEYALYTIHQELTRALVGMSNMDVELTPLLGSVVDRKRMLLILETWRPATVFHAAAYKHVPLVEHNPAEGIRNNLLGTQVIADLSGLCGVADLLLVSTDKAVRPTNIMGATKRGAELVMQAMSERYPHTRFSMVRFGNVLGSSGSVVPLFRQQIEQGGPVTITDKRIIRYFMTIPEASQLVLQACSLAQGGEVFVLDMGEPVKIYDLARNLIELMGLTVQDADHPDGDIEIKEVGIRPGEKLYEELLIGNSPTPTVHPKIMMAHEKCLTLSEVDTLIEEMKLAMSNESPEMLIDILKKLVEEFSASAHIVDWVYKARNPLR